MAHIVMIYKLGWKDVAKYIFAESSRVGNWDPPKRICVELAGLLRSFAAGTPSNLGAPDPQSRSINSKPTLNLPSANLLTQSPALSEWIM